VVLLSVIALALGGGGGPGAGNGVSSPTASGFPSTSQPEASATADVQAPLFRQFATHLSASSALVTQILSAIYIDGYNTNLESMTADGTRLQAWAAYEGAWLDNHPATACFSAVSDNWRSVVDDATALAADIAAGDYRTGTSDLHYMNQDLNSVKAQVQTTIC
jgi:hypothetical protein